MIECVPPASVVVVRLAAPVASIVIVPRLVVPSMKVIDPAGIPAPAASEATVAMSVTLCPNVIRLFVETRLTVVAPTCTMLAADVLPT